MTLTDAVLDRALPESSSPTDPEPGPTSDAGGPAFADLPLGPALQRTVADLGYTTPTPIQAEAIGPLVEGRDLIGQAATGTGKTAAFALPMLERLGELRPERTRAAAPFGLVLAPTRELALQVAEAIGTYGHGLGARVLTVYGGAPVGPQLRGLAEGVDVVVATPGRAIDLMNRGALDLSGLEVVVLDEADEMLDMGFVEDIETLLDATPDTRQGVLFSATMPRRIEDLAQSYLREPVTVRIRREEVPAGEAPLVRQTAYLVPRTHTTAALGRVLEAERPKAAIVFCRTRLDVDAVTETLTARGLRAEALHGGMDQEHRSRVVDRLRSGRTELLVATDVAARGLDIDLLTHVVNHDVPQSPETYVHRRHAGRQAHGGGHQVRRDRPHRHHQRAVHPPGWAALPLRHVHGHVAALLDVPQRDAVLGQRRLEGERAADVEGHQVVAPVREQVGRLVDEPAVAPHAVAGQVGADVRAGREGGGGLADVADVEHRAGLRVALGEQQEVVGPVLRDGDQVRLGVPGAPARGGRDQPVTEAGPGVRRRHGGRSRGDRHVSSRPRVSGSPNRARTARA